MARKGLISIGNGGYHPTSNTFLYLKFAGNTKNQVNDVTASYTQNLGYADGVGGWCGTFVSGATTGTSTAFKIAGPSSGVLIGNFTISFWAKIRGTSMNVNSGIVSRDVIGTTYPQFTITAGTAMKPTLSVYKFNNAGAPTASVKSATAMSTTSFNNYVFTRDGTNIYVYCNGVYEASAAWTQAQWNSTGLVAVGCRSTSDTNITCWINGMFDGFIDEVIIENTAWTAQRVKDYWNKIGEL